VLDFQNETQTIVDSFASFYRTTVLSEETDANKLHDLKHALDERQVYSPEQVDALVALFLQGAERDQLDAILDRCVDVYLRQLDEDAQVEFKGKAKAFVRTYDFLAALLPYTNREWERLSILLNLLIPKLPAPKEEDLSRGILESIDMDSYRAEKQAAARLVLPDQDAEIGPVPVSAGGRQLDPEIDRLSSIIKSFNEQFGTNFQDGDRIIRRIKEEVVPSVAADPAYQNAKLNTPQTARLEHDKALEKAMLRFIKDDTEFYKQFVQNPSFKRFLADLSYSETREPGRPPSSPP
jgi:type I restriction enzyme R subunit